MRIVALVVPVCFPMIPRTGVKYGGARRVDSGGSRTVILTPLSRMMMVIGTGIRRRNGRHYGAGISTRSCTGHIVNV